VDNIIFVEIFDAFEDLLEETFHWPQHNTHDGWNLLLEYIEHEHYRVNSPSPFKEENDASLIPYQMTKQEEYEPAHNTPSPISIPQSTIEP